MKLFTRIFLALMALAFMKVGIEALINPQAVVAQVGITLENASALSSIRAIYGGMHFVFGLFCVWGILRDPDSALRLIMLYTAGFIVGRISGIVSDGMPNPFVITWAITESVSFLIAGFIFTNGFRRFTTQKIQSAV